MVETHLHFWDEDRSGDVCLDQLVEYEIGQKIKLSIHSEKEAKDFFGITNTFDDFLYVFNEALTTRGKYKPPRNGIYSVSTDSGLVLCHHTKSHFERVYKLVRDPDQETK